MTHAMMFTEEELKELFEILEGELAETRIEHRRARDADFRTGLEHRIERMQRLQEKMAAELGIRSPAQE